MNKKDSRQSLGDVFSVLLPSVKMKSFSVRGKLLDREFHEFLLTNFHGYTVASGNITGYWRQEGEKQETCNEHQEYQIALRNRADRNRLEKHLRELRRELEEETIYCVFNGKAFLLR